MQCANNFKQVGLALHNYHSAKGSFPPGMFDKSATSSAPSYFSWSAYVLPYLEQQGVYDLFGNFSVTYYAASPTTTSQTNANSASSTPIAAYMCPSDAQAGEGIWEVGTMAPQCAMSNICGVSDSYDWTRDSLHHWPRAFPNNDGVFGGNLPCSISDIKDGTSNTLMLGEMGGAGKGTYFGQAWVCFNISDTSDGINGPSTVVGGVYGGYLPVDDYSSYFAGFGSFHPGGCNFGLADGSVSFLSQNIAHSTLAALTTRDGPSPLNINANHAVSPEPLVSGAP